MDWDDKKSGADAARLAVVSGLHVLGNSSLLAFPKVAFLCSRTSPPDLAPRLRDWAAEQRRSEICVISGFHSSMEKLVLRQLLQGHQPIILALASGIPSQVAPELQAPLAAGRLLIITRYAPSVTHPCREKCQQRNRLMLELADEVVVAYASAGGTLERLCREYGGLKRVDYLSGAAGAPGGVPG